jgi:predicted MFS family arabinose efflux permease
VHLPTTLRALSSRSGLRRAVVAYGLYGLVELSCWFAIILYAFARGGPQLAGLVAVAQVVPAAFVAPVLSGYAERLPRGTALVMGYGSIAIITAITSLALLADAPTAVIVLLATVNTTAIAVVRPIHFAALPQLSRGPEELVSANALATIADGLALFAGPIAAGLLTQAVGTWLVFFCACLIAGAATALCLRLGLTSATREEIEEEEEAPEWRAAIDGLSSLWGDWAALALLAIMATKFVVAGASDVLGVTFSEEVLHQGESGAGVMLAGLGIGALIGGAMSASFAVRRTLSPIVGICGLAIGISVSAVAVMTILPPAMAALTITGLGGSLLMISGRTLLQRTTDGRVMTRVFAVQESTSLLGVAVGAAAAPLLVDWLHPPGAWAVLGACLALLAVVALVFIRSLDGRAILLPDEIALLRRVPFLSVLPAYELERLARSARWTDVTTDQDVIRQGEAGDQFYVIGDGEFEVTIDGRTRPDRLMQGQSFGEIALLYAVPRTATVTARTDGRLLALSKDDFLAAVTGSEDGAAIATEISEAYLARDRERRA